MIVGITGKARHGKDEIRKVLEQDFGFTRVALADPLKRCMQVMFGWGRIHTEGDLKDVLDERYGISPRQGMQAIGTDFAQDLLSNLFPEYDRITGRTLWVKRLLQHVDHEGLTDVAIPDVRFPHEAEALRKRGGFIIRVVRPDFDTNVHAHRSETAMDKIIEDARIWNDGTLDDLRESVHYAMKALRGMSREHDHATVGSGSAAD